MPKLKNILPFDDHLFLSKTALITFVLLLASFQIYSVFYYPIWRDDSFLAAVAKNLINGEGYAAVFFDKSYLFHHGISSGPLIILPAALLMFFFGDQYWVPGMANIILIWCLLVTAFFAADVVGKEKKWSFCFLALFFSLIFSVGEYGNENLDKLTLWHLLMGEIPAALCVIIGALLLLPSKGSRVLNIEASKFYNKKLVFGGLFLGFAMIGKTITAIAVVVIILAYIAKTLKAKNLKKSQQLQSIAVVVLCAIMPFILFELVKIFLLGWQGYLELQKATAEFYKHNALIILSRENNGVSTSADIVEHVKHLLNFFGISGLMLVPVTVYLMESVYKKNNPYVPSTYGMGFPAMRGAAHAAFPYPEGIKVENNDNIFPVAVTLILCFSIHLCWWICFAPLAADRYFVTALIYYFVALSLLLVKIDYKYQSSLQIKVIASFIFFLLISRSDEINYLAGGFRNTDSKKLQEQLDVVSVVDGLKEQGIVTISCGNNFELEYLLPKSRNFENCNKILGKPLNHPTILVSYFLDSSSEILSVGSSDYYAATKPISDAILSKCNREFLRTKNFLLSWCH